MAERIYLDWNATAPLRAAARAAALEAFGLCGNPSSVHAEGRAVRRRIEEARENVAAQVGALAHAAGGLLHVDAVQAGGRISCNINELQADLMTLSGHKIGAPKGVGALIKRDQALHLSDPLIKGGGQERGARAGTENVAAIA